MPIGSLGALRIKTSLHTGAKSVNAKWQETNGRFFGLFHWNDRTTVEVRIGVLKGDWPEKLTPEMMENLLAMGTMPH